MQFSSYYCKNLNTLIIQSAKKKNAYFSCIWWHKHVCLYPSRVRTLLLMTRLMIKQMALWDRFQSITSQWASAALSSYWHGLGLNQVLDGCDFTPAHCHSARKHLMLGSKGWACLILLFSYSEKSLKFQFCCLKFPYIKIFILLYFYMKRLNG